MDEKVHHRCACLGLSFTFGEWVRYCREHSSDEDVFTYKSFKFNICDVCLTPNVKMFSRKPFQIEINTAESPNGRWDYGVVFSLPDRGRVSAPKFCECVTQGFASEQDAVYDGLCKAEEFAIGAIRDAKFHAGCSDGDDDGCRIERGEIPKLNALLRVILKYKDVYDPSQLSLFGF